MPHRTCILSAPYLFLALQLNANVSQDWDTYLTGLGILREQFCPGSPNLWCSLCRYILFRTCAASWTPTEPENKRVDFIGGMTSSQLYIWYMKEAVHGDKCSGHELGLNWRSSWSHYVQDTRRLDVSHSQVVKTLHCQYRECKFNPWPWNWNPTCLTAK